VPASELICSKAFIRDLGKANQKIIGGLKAVNLENAILESETMGFHTKMTQSSRGVFGFHDLMREITLDLDSSTVLIGLSGYKTMGQSEMREVFTGVAKTLGVRTWMEIYDSLNLNIENPNHTQEFMAYLENSGSKIVFLVPPELFSFKKDGQTLKNGILQKEFSFLFEHGHERRLKNVYFVYGFYDAFNSPNLIQQLSALPYGYRRELYIRKLLQDYFLIDPENQDDRLRTERLRRRIQ
jgi:hypothetical protein